MLRAGMWIAEFGGFFSYKNKLQYVQFLKQESVQLFLWKDYRQLTNYRYELQFLQLILNYVKKGCT